MDLDEKKQEVIKSINTDLESVSLDDIKSDGVTIRCGNKIIEMVVKSEYEDTSIESLVRDELREKLQERLTNISDVVKKKLNDMSDYVYTLKNEYEKKSKDLEKRLSSSNLMPDITYNHTRRGLSVSKSSDGSLLWIVQAVYWPKYIDDRVIDVSYSKRLINHILVVIETNGNKVLNVRLKRPIGFESFEHYHTNCWGGWKWSSNWNTPDDIIEIAKQAEIVLETINTRSLANHSPRGLMRVSTVEKNSKPRSASESDNFTANKRSENIGISDNFTRENVWST